MEGSKEIGDCLQGTSIPEFTRASVDRFAVSENNTILNVQVVVWQN